MDGEVFAEHDVRDVLATALADELDVLVFEGRGIDHRPDELEGERFLVSDVALELHSYPREVLLTRSWCAICRRGRVDE